MKLFVLCTENRKKNPSGRINFFYTKKVILSEKTSVNVLSVINIVTPISDFLFKSDFFFMFF
jgi:hypothetical protein